jgi:hypothetical protein
MKKIDLKQIRINNYEACRIDTLIDYQCSKNIRIFLIKSRYSHILKLSHFRNVSNLIEAEIDSYYEKIRD